MKINQDLAWAAWRVALHETQHAPTRELLTLADERRLFDAWWPTAPSDGGRRELALAAWNEARAPQTETHEDTHYVLTFDAWWERLMSAGFA